MLVRATILLAFVLGSHQGTAQPADDRKQPAQLEARGTIVPAKRALATSTIPGRVAEVLVEEGQSVKKDQVLFRLDRSASEAALKRSEAEVELAMERLKQ